MSIKMVKNIGKKIDFRITLSEGDRIEILINTVSEIDKTIPVGREGTVLIYYQEDVIL